MQSWTQLRLCSRDKVRGAVPCTAPAMLRGNRGSIFGAILSQGQVGGPSSIPAAHLSERWAASPPPPCSISAALGAFDLPPNSNYRTATAIMCYAMFSSDVSRDILVSGVGQGQQLKNEIDITQNLEQRLPLLIAVTHFTLVTLLVVLRRFCWQPTLAFRSLWKSFPAFTGKPEVASGGFCVPFWRHLGASRVGCCQRNPEEAINLKPYRWKDQPTTHPTWACDPHFGKVWSRRSKNENFQSQSIRLAWSKL